MLLEFNEQTRVEYTRYKGHVYISIPLVYEGSTNTDKIPFIYDTGAYLTVINRELYEDYELFKLPRYETILGGYAGSAPGYMFQIPGLVIGRQLLTGVWAFSPKSINENQNLLGDNVIEYFMPFQDNEHDCLYFPDNPAPEPYVHPETNFSLACDSVMYAEGKQA